MSDGQLTIKIRITPEMDERLRRLARHLPVATFARAALALGLDVIELQPGTLIGEEPTPETVLAAKLDDSPARERFRTKATVLALGKEGKRHREIARLTGFSESYVSQVLTDHGIQTNRPGASPVGSDDDIRALLRQGLSVAQVREQIGCGKKRVLAIRRQIDANPAEAMRRHARVK